MAKSATPNHQAQRRPRNRSRAATRIATASAIRNTPEIGPIEWKSTAPSGFNLQRWSRRRLGKSKLTPTTKAMRLAKKRNEEMTRTVFGRTRSLVTPPLIWRQALQPGQQVPAEHRQELPAMNRHLQAPCRWIPYRVPAPSRPGSIRG